MVADPPTKPIPLSIRNVKIAGNNRSADEAATSNKMIITSTNGFSAGMGMKNAVPRPKHVTTTASINDIPIANDITVSTNETKFISLDITLDVTDADGDALTYSIESNASNATTSLNGDIVTYVPTTDWNGSDSFTYKANDGIVDSNIATVNITVVAINDAPVVADTTVTIDEDKTVSYLNYTKGNSPETAQGMHLLRVTDVDSDTQYPNMAFSFPENMTDNSSDTSDGYIIFVEDASTGLHYTNFQPFLNFNGTIALNYRASDQGSEVYSEANSNTGTVTIIVNPVNDAPTAENISTTVDYNWTGHTIKIKGDSAGGSDVDGDALTFSIVTPPSNGNVYNDAGGGIPDGGALVSGDELTSSLTIYNAETGFYGEDSFTFRVDDGNLSSIGTVTITVNPYSPEIIESISDFDLVISTTETSDGGYIVSGESGNENEGKIAKVGPSPYTVEWTTSINIPSSNHAEHVYKTIELSNGNYAFIGHITTNNKMFYGLLDNNGNQIYLNEGSTISSNPASRGMNLSELSNGNILITTYEFNGNPQSGGVIATFSGDFESLIDYHLVPDTNFEWYRNNDNIILDSQDNFIISSNINWSSDYRNYITSGDSGFNNVVNTELLFSHEVALTEIIENSNGNIVACGYTIENNDHDFFFTEFDKNGNIILEKKFENFDGEQIASSIKQLDDNSYIILGNHQSSEIVEVFKIDSQANLIWSNKLQFDGVQTTANIHLLSNGFVASFGNSSNAYIIEDSFP